MFYVSLLSPRMQALHRNRTFFHCHSSVIQVFPLSLRTQACCAACVWFYRDMIVFVPGGCTVLALIVLLLLWRQRLGTLRKFRGE